MVVDILSIFYLIVGLWKDLDKYMLPLGCQIHKCISCSCCCSADSGRSWAEDENDVEKCTNPLEQAIFFLSYIEEYKHSSRRYTMHNKPLIKQRHTSQYHMHFSLEKTLVFLWNVHTICIGRRHRPFGKKTFFFLSEMSRIYIYIHSSNWHSTERNPWEGRMTIRMHEKNPLQRTLFSLWRICTYILWIQYRTTGSFLAGGE